jgi:hypothetical protein
MREIALNYFRQRDRADLAVLLGTVNGAHTALKRDQRGDPVIAGSRGSIRACNGSFSIHVACRSRRHWFFVKKAMASFCTIAQDGDDEGILRLNRLPVGEEAGRLRAAIGLRQTRPPPAVSISSRLQGQINAKYAPKTARGHLTTPDSEEAVSGPRRAGKSSIASLIAIYAAAASGDEGGAT